MSTKEILQNKISSIEKYLTLLTAFKSYSENEIKKNTTLLGAIERYAYLAVQATIDLAEASISYKRLRKPASMSDSFNILQENNIINLELADKMIKMVGFRNVLAHDYDTVDFKILYSVLNEKNKDIEKFINDIKQYFSL